MDRLSQAELFVARVARLNDHERYVRASHDSAVQDVQKIEHILACAKEDSRRDEEHMNNELEAINAYREVWVYLFLSWSILI